MVEAVGVAAAAAVAAVVAVNVLLCADVCRESTWEKSRHSRRWRVATSSVCMHRNAVSVTPTCKYLQGAFLARFLLLSSHDRTLQRLWQVGKTS